MFQTFSYVNEYRILVFSRILHQCRIAYMLIVAFGSPSVLKYMKCKSHLQFEPQTVWCTLIKGLVVFDFLWMLLHNIPSATSHFCIIYRWVRVWINQGNAIFGTHFHPLDIELRHLDASGISFLSVPLAKIDICDRHR